MTETPIFEHHLDFDPSADFEAFVKLAPAKWAVYLLSDANDRPVQLLCVKNLRYSLRRRLGHEGEQGGLSRRVNYRELVRRVKWRRVDGAFEADWIYYEAARAVFPESYRGMVGFRPAWFVHVDTEAKFPRYAKTIDLSPRPGMLIGPVEDKHAANRLIETVEDAFDLCRYYNVLTQAPGGLACAYKEMGKCPAPCDGSIAMEQYRRMVEWSARTLVDPAEFLRGHAQRMKAAAAELRFETAAKIKAYIEQIALLGKGPFRHLGKFRNFAYLSFQHGPRPDRGNARIFLITPGMIEEILGLIGKPKPGEVLRQAFMLADERMADGVDPIGAERIGVVGGNFF
jgi:excinuclease UvrABC nuclease subunit